MLAWDKHASLASAASLATKTKFWRQTRRNRGHRVRQAVLVQGPNRDGDLVTNEKLFHFVID
jgi:hypothetical protein